MPKAADKTRIRNAADALGEIQVQDLLAFNVSPEVQTAIASLHIALLAAIGETSLPPKTVGKAITAVVEKGNGNEH